MESLATAAHRELIEETGYEAQEMKLLTSGPPSPGLSAEMVHVFRTRGLRRVGAGGGDATEDITVHEVSMSQIVPWLEAKAAEGRMIDPKVYSGLFFAILERENSVLDGKSIPELQRV
ncbi:MAG: NUDIX hydrolase [Deltaproteobacteria bacterium]|nr:NUDIX hydrolase [Deltaproteobacteria bacterium]